MNRLQESLRAEHLRQAAAIVDSLPEPDYAANYQPTYPDPESLVQAVAELVTTEGVSTPARARELTERLAPVGAGESDELVVITGGCREKIQLEVPIADLAQDVEVSQAIVAGSKLQRVVSIHRGLGQYKKPRSATDGIPYMGDLINGEDEGSRTPDPSRLVGGANQAFVLRTALDARTGTYLPVAHEALSLAYEKPFLRPDESGETFLASADMPWIGLRTNQLDSVIIEMLTGVGNTVGAKIGSNSTEAHIAGLEERLNPNNEPGKSVYMLRLGLHEARHYPRILNAVRKYAPKCILLFDVHGITRTVERSGKKYKIRAVSDMLKGMQLMHNACQEAGVRFDGVHLETITNSKRVECVDYPDETPLHEGGIDPQSNPRQTTIVLNALAALAAGKRIA